MTACVVAGCVVRGAHLDDEAYEAATGDAHPADCRGCLPTEAEHGFLCGGDSRRLRDHLGAREGLRLHRDDCETRHGARHCECPDAPHGLAWAWDALTNAHPLVATPAPSDRTGKRTISDPEADRLSNVLALRDDIRDWAVHTTADLADRTNLNGPDGVRLTTDYRERTTTRDSRRAVHRCATWLLRHVESLEGGQGISDPDSAAESVALLVDELARLMTRAHALAPWRPAPTHVDGIPCRCGATALRDHGEEVHCWACGATYTREQYDTLCKVLAARYGGTRSA